MPKHLTPAERSHWSRVQAAVIRSFNFWAKRKINPGYVIKLADELADKATASYRKRIGSNGK